MRKKLNTVELHLEKSKKLPGPGSYGHNDHTGAPQVPSRMPNSQKNAFSKATDRFRSTGFDNPSPQVYSPRDEINKNFNSTRKYVGATKIGNNKINY